MAEKKAETSDDIPPAPEGLTREETRSVKERRRLRAAVVYEIIRLEGEKELARSFSALWWSALAAGISIGFSVLSQGMLAALLGDMPGAAIIADLGYTVGFLIVILAHQQLFTENTLTAVQGDFVCATAVGNRARRQRCGLLFVCCLPRLLGRIECRVRRRRPGNR